MKVLKTELPTDVMIKVAQAISTVEPRTGVNVQNHMKFGKKGQAEIKCLKYDNSVNYVGELNKWN